MKTHNPRPHQNLLFSEIALVIAMFAVVGVTIWTLLPEYLRSGPNSAQDAARPLEEALLARGAHKQCDYSASGRGPDNYIPSYTAHFRLDANREEALRVVTAIAEKNGFKQLVQEKSPYESLRWYADKVSVKSTYPGHKNGNVKLFLSLFSNSKEVPLDCSETQRLQADANHTAIRLDVSLPSGD